MKTAKQNLLSQFAKGKKSNSTVTRRLGVIYTRVSSYEQLGNTSLDTQLRECRAFALRNEIKVEMEFGGTYESAKSDDERKEFKSMLTYLNRRRSITDVIVYDLSRFSRTGGPAIAIIDRLRDKGITVHAATQPADTDTAAGKMMQSMSLIYSHIDNQMKRERTIAGMIAKMRQGGYCGRAPHGYKFENKVLVPDKKAIHIKNIFKWKAREGISNEEIRVRLRKRGWSISKQTLSFVLQNPTYCGLISHSLLEGEILPGNWKPLITQDLFLKANDVKHHIPRGYKVSPDNIEVPLKRFMKCIKCGQKLRGYHAKARGIWYYKCCTVGCSCNKRADDLHELFRAELRKYALPNALIDVVKQALEALLVEHEDSQFAELESLQRSLVELDKKINRIEERFMWEEIPAELYKKHRPKLDEDRTRILLEIESAKNKVSNIESFIAEGVDFAANLPVLWDKGDFKDKQRIQKMVFPEGIHFDKENDNCRTFLVSEVFRVFGSLKANFEQKKLDNPEDFSELSNWAPPLGLEPRTY